jgi:hypothetical protein
MDGRADVAARYPPGLSRAICRGIIKEKKRRKGGLMPLMRVEAKTSKDGLPDKEEFHERQEKVGKEGVKGCFRQY